MRIVVKFFLAREHADGIIEIVVAYRTSHFQYLGLAAATSGIVAALYLVVSAKVQHLAGLESQVQSGYPFQRLDEIDGSQLQIHTLVGDASDVEVGLAVAADGW